MTTKYQQFTETLSKKPQSLIKFYLPNGNQIPEHFHLTDVGSVFRHFIDCGAQVRDESYVQIQLWLGKDIDHRLNGETVLKILSHSNVVLDKLPNLQNTDVIIEYKEELTSQYPIERIEHTEQVIKIYLKPSETQCLAVRRHEKNKISGESCCGSKSSCG
jgi:hypothetical protein